MLICRDFAEVKNDSITVLNTTVDLTTYGQPVRMIDEIKWYIIVCSWKRNGKLLVVVDGVKVFEGMSVLGILPKV